MRKILVCLLLVLLTVALIACGGNGDTTTTEPATTTTEPATTTTPAPSQDETTPADSTPATPADGPIDIMNNIANPEYNTVKYDYDGIKAFTFEDFHVDLDYNIALVIIMNECDACLYEEFFYTLAEDDNSQYEINPSYKWEVVIDGEAIAIERITLANYKTHGWVRFDLGSDFKFSNYEYDEDDVHYFDVKINIYDASNDLAYFAYLTDPNYNGPYEHVKPAPIEMVADPNRPQNVEALEPNRDFTPISGATVSNGEVFENMFDGTVRTKYCTGKNGIEGGMIVRIDTPSTEIIGLSFVNANDNDTYNGRTLVSFDIYVSDDGENWGEPVITVDGSDITDRSSISKNYLERYYALDKAITGPFIMIVANNNDTFQISEMIFYVEK